MLLVELIRFLSGFVKFTGTGGFSERFINLCSVNDIPLWNISYYDGYFSACTSIDGYFKIPICARNSGVKVKKTRAVGLPFIIRRLRPRVGLLIGAVFFIVCFSLLSNRVWIIDINGNGTIPKDTIISALTSAGLKTGQKTDTLNVVQLSLDTCEKVDGVSWAAIRVNGCCVYVDIKQSDPAPKLENKDGAYNIVAAKDAQLVILEPYRGTSQSKVFNSVIKGQTLISGITLNRDESVSFVHASGYAVGRTDTRIEASMPTGVNSTRYIPTKNVYFLHFFGITIPLGKKPAEFSQKFCKSSMLSYNQKVLPIGISQEEYYAKKTENKKISPSQARLISINEFLKKSAEFSKGKQILKNNISFKENDSVTTVTGDFICYENIGIESPLETEEIPY